MYLCICESCYYQIATCIKDLLITKLWNLDQNNGKNVRTGMETAMESVF